MTIQGDPGRHLCKGTERDRGTERHRGKDEQGARELCFRRASFVLCPFPPNTSQICEGHTVVSFLGGLATEAPRLQQPVHLISSGATKRLDQVKTAIAMGSAQDGDHSM